MPLNVEIKINGKALSVLTVARIDGFFGDDEQPSTYEVFEEYNSEGADARRKETFQHRRADGYTVCIAKALTAWSKP